jgi:hypothetical protein
MKSKSNKCTKLRPQAVAQEQKISKFWGRLSLRRKTAQEEQAEGIRKLPVVGSILKALSSNCCKVSTSFVP